LPIFDFQLEIKVYTIDHKDTGLKKLLLQLALLLCIFTGSGYSIYAQDTAKHPAPTEVVVSADAKKVRAARFSYINAQSISLYYKPHFSIRKYECRLSAQYAAAHNLYLGIKPLLRRHYIQSRLLHNYLHAPIV